MQRHSPGDQRPTLSRTLRHAEPCPGPRSCVGTTAYRQSLKRRNVFCMLPRTLHWNKDKPGGTTLLAYTDQAQRIELELRRTTKYTPWVPNINALQNNFLQIRRVRSGYETAYKRNISLASPDFERFGPCHCFKHAIAHSQNYKLQTTTNYKHSTKDNTFQSNYE